MSSTVNYTIFVETGGEFDPTLGNVNVVFKAPGITDTVKTERSLCSFRPYQRCFFQAQSNIPVPKLNGAAFQWQSLSGYPTTITLDTVTIDPSYLEEPSRSQFTQTFCASGYIDSGVFKTLDQC